MGRGGVWVVLFVIIWKVLYTYIGISGIPPFSYFPKLERFFHRWKYMWLEMKGQVGDIWNLTFFETLLFLPPQRFESLLLLNHSCHLILPKRCFDNFNGSSPSVTAGEDSGFER